MSANGPPEDATRPRMDAARTGAPAVAPETLEGLRARDPEALAVVFRTYFPRVYNLAHRILGNRWQAEDVSQDVFLKVYRAADTFDTARDPWPWLARITYNACRDHWRSWAHRMNRGSVTFDVVRASDEGAFVSPESPERDLARSEESRRVQMALMKLSERNRAIVMLHDYEGLRHDEIATIVGLNAAAVRKRYSRSLAELARHLEAGDGT